MRNMPRPAIRPYPRDYVGAWTTRQGTPLIIRPIRPEDEPLISAFHQTLSEQSVYFRYLHPLALAQRVAHERLARVCFVDYDRQMVLVAERPAEPRSGDGAPAGAEAEIVGVGRLSRIPWTDDAEFALVVADEWQGKGLGRALLERLCEAARAAGYRALIGHILHANRDMLELAAHVGFTEQSQHGDTVTVARTLT